jgi:MoxR-like ATPase
MTDTNRLKETLASARAEVAKVIIGQADVVDKCLIAIITGQHALVEGVPGVAKTLLVRTLAHVLGCNFARIQFTPDLMPADITGTSVFNLQKNEFTLVKGPIFTSFLLADEINRAPAKTQSALLQAMQERVVTIDRETHALPPNFTVFATQNPIEYEGTFPLPEAQLDRFLLRVRMGYPSASEEMKIMNGQQLRHPIETLKSVVKVREALSAIKAVREVFVSPAIQRYIIELVGRTRQSNDVYLGASPRGSLALFRAGQARAALNGRDHVLPDDIKTLAVPVLGHRVIVSPAARLRELSADRIVEEVVHGSAVPGGDYRASGAARREAASPSPAKGKAK